MAVKNLLAGAVKTGLNAAAYSFGILTPFAAAYVGAWFLDYRYDKKRRSAT